MYGWMGNGEGRKREEIKRERSAIPSWEGKSMGSAQGLPFKKRLHLNNSKSIRIKYITFLSSLLPRIYLFCFVLARLNPHILFVQAVKQICQAGNS